MPPKKTKQNAGQRAQPKQKQSKPKQKATPFANAGAIVGHKVGQMFNAPYLKGVGKWLGSGIGQIFGSGDYTTVGSDPKYNVLTNASQIPKFDTTRASNVVCHREYLGDIIGTSVFNNVLYPLNPGIASTFPWLSTVAQNYQEYQFHGLIFEFRPLITDFVTSGAPGVVVMVTNYNADVPVYASKQAMENSEFAVSVKPTMALMHGVECAPSQTVLRKAYVRTGAVPAGQDLRLYDLGNFQFATQANPVQDLGELWVSYCVEFSKPILPLDVGGDIGSAFCERGTVSSAAPLGLVAVNIASDLQGFVPSSTGFSWVASPGNMYLIVVTWLGGAVVITNPASTFTGLTGVNQFNGKSVSFTLSPPNGTSTGNMTNTYLMRCTLPNPGNVTFGFNASGVFPTTSLVEISVTEWSNSAT